MEVTGPVVNPESYPVHNQIHGLGPIKYESGAIIFFLDNGVTNEFLIANSNIFEDPDKQTGLFNETPSFNFFKPNICTRLVWLARSNSIQPMQSRQHPAAAAAGPCQQQPVWSLKMPNWATFFLPHVSSVPFLTV